MPFGLTVKIFHTMFENYLRFEIIHLNEKNNVKVNSPDPLVLIRRQKGAQFGTYKFVLARL